MRLAISPPDALLDRGQQIAVTDVPQGAGVTVRLRCETLRAEATAVFVADATGTVDTSRHGPVEGSYEGVDPAGLFWSEAFDGDSGLLTMLDTLGRLEPLVYTASATVNGATASVTFRRHSVAGNIVSTDVRAGRVRGTLFAPAGAARLPAVIVLGGSGGGNTFAFMAALLASHGLVALSLPYFAYDDLPTEMIEIPLEYFEEAIAVLRSRPEVGAAPIGVFGMSRGGELALLLGSTYSTIAAVAALVPSGLTGGGIGKGFDALMRSAWSLGGKPFPVLPPAMDSESKAAASRAVATGEPLRVAPSIDRVLDAAPHLLEAAAIPVERIRGPVFLMSAQDDQMWPSSRLSDVAVARLRASGFPHPVEHHAYQGAGHFAVLPPYLPATAHSSMVSAFPMAFEYGGTARDTAAASADLWRRLPEFLTRHLRR